MSSKWRILKFGGTSVAGAAQWRAIEKLVSSRVEGSDRILVVVSALAGITNLLDALCENGADFSGIRDQVIARHNALAVDLDVDASQLLEQGSALLDEKIQAFQNQATPEHRAGLLAIGEWLSSRLGAIILARSLDTKWVDARGVLQSQPEENPGSRRAWLSARCDVSSDQQFQDKWQDGARVLITQGFVASNADGNTVVLGRGGSDTSAALMASRLGAQEVEIWTDVPGLFSADPALESQALLIRSLDYSEALEMAGSGARVVHPRCIRVAAETGMPILIRDLSRPDVMGTRISGSNSAVTKEVPVTGIKAITCQERMLVILLENLDSRQQVGFLAWVFGAFSDLGISIDLVATSETTTTVAINCVDNHLDSGLLEQITASLSQRCMIRLFNDCCCVNLVGRGARTALSRMGQAVSGFDEWPLLMLSQSANDMSISFLVRPDHAAALVGELHQHLIVSGDIVENSDVYGESWSTLERSG